MTKITAFLMSILMFLFPKLNLPKTEVDPSTWNNDYTTVFVHGLGGWGEGNPMNMLLPYWGMLGGDAVTYLRERGFDCCAADVNPSASAWDRACELYAQLTGTRVDYGVEHSQRCGHKRFGKNYSRHPLLESFSAEDKIHLVAHSFGGATVLQFLDLMTHGSPAEQQATPQNISGLFTGGKGDWIASIMTLASPMNGTTAYDLKPIIDKDWKSTLPERFVTLVCGAASIPPLDGRIQEDSAAYDMTVDGAAELLARLNLPDDVYYFSVPCSTVTQGEDGSYKARKETEPMFKASANRLSSFSYTTPKGTVIDEKWFPNDGLVNTVSAVAPFGAPTTDMNAEDIRPGVWNVYPTYAGDHFSLSGGFLHNNAVRELYVDYLTMLHSL